MTAIDPNEDTLHVEKPTGFEQVPAALYDNTDITDGAVRLYIILSSYGGREDKAMPRKKTIAARLGKGVSAVDDRITNLRQHGWLLVTPRWRSGNGVGGQGPNHYQLLWKPITSHDDPRLKRHKAAVARFHEQKKAAQERNLKEAEAAKSATPTRNSGRGRNVQTPPGKSGAPHPEFRVPPTRNSGPLYPDCSYPDPVLTDNGRGAVAPSPGSVDLFGQEEQPATPPIGNQATAAFVEAWQQTHHRPPLAKHRSAIGNAARHLAKGGATTEEILTAARRCAEGGFLDLDRQWRQDQTNRRSRPSTTDQRVAAGLALIQKFALEEGHQ